jgi:hypothetical protein
LKKGCKPVIADEVIPGDLFVQNERGGIGHVSVVLDVCKSKEGKKLFLIGYSFMPAQEFHIERARGKYGIGGWFTLEGYVQYLRDYLNYGEPVLRRFDPHHSDRGRAAGFNHRMGPFHRFSPGSDYSQGGGQEAVSWPLQRVEGSLPEPFI